MKVFMPQQAAPHIGGMFRVLEGLNTHLKLAGIEFVDNIEKCDVAHHHIAIFENIPYDVPLVISSHGLLWSSDGWGKHGWSVNKQCYASYVQADIVTAPSEFVAKSIARNSLVDARVVRHAIDADVWTPVKMKEGYVLWNKARVDPANKPEIVALLADRAQDVPFVTTFGAQRPNVRVTGKRTPEEILELVQGAGVYLDTPRESGGPCFGVLEAMSCGVPVLAWNMGGNAEAVLHQETGYLAEPDNLEDMLQGLHYCLEHKDRLGAAGRELVLAKYQWEHVIPDYIQAYELALTRQQFTTEVSVIIPCHNLGKYLPRCVASVQQQTHQNWEVIIVDDASSDNSWSVAQHLAKDDERIKAIRNVGNLHVSDTRNRGIHVAGGRYILPLDADDALAPAALERMVSVLNQDRNTAIVGGKLRIHRDGEWETGYIGDWPNNVEFDLQMAGHNRLPYASMYRKFVWARQGGYRRRIRSGVEDADFWTRAFSYGYKAQILSDVTLLYTLRDKSLSRENNVSVNTWLDWFPWTYRVELTPTAATGEGPYLTFSYDTPEISVIIPVGPGHEHHIQGCIDSVIAQTFPNWEIILVNDTGIPWTVDEEIVSEHVKHLSFIKIIDSAVNCGVAKARNKGIELAKAPFCLFLDVDDVAQPNAMEVLLYAHQQAGCGWVYGDWYIASEGQVKESVAKDWSTRELLTKALAPITGLYPTKEVRAVGGFDAQIPGWEDWDLQLNLLMRGVCGVRVNVPLITYNMDFGQRREEDLEGGKLIVDYIKSKYHDVYVGGKKVACKKCGNDRRTTVVVNRSGGNVMDAKDTNSIRVVYTGPQAQARRVPSKSRRGVNYKIQPGIPFDIYREDAEFILRRPHMSIVKEAAPPSQPDDSAALVSQAAASPVQDVFEQLIEDVAQMEVKIPVKELGLPEDLLDKLATKFEFIYQIVEAKDVEIKAIKGIGPSALQRIREACKQWEFRM